MSSPTEWPYFGREAYFGLGISFEGSSASYQFVSFLFLTDGRYSMIDELPFPSLSVRPPSGVGFQRGACSPFEAK